MGGPPLLVSSPSRCWTYDLTAVPLDWTEPPGPERSRTPSAERLALPLGASQAEALPPGGDDQGLVVVRPGRFGGGVVVVAMSGQAFVGSQQGSGSHFQAEAS